MEEFLQAEGHRCSLTIVGVRICVRIVICPGRRENLIEESAVHPAFVDRLREFQFLQALSETPARPRNELRERVRV